MTDQSDVVSAGFRPVEMSKNDIREESCTKLNEARTADAQSDCQSKGCGKEVEACRDLQGAKDRQWTGILWQRRGTVGLRHWQS
jgi:hypothetical protein